MNSISYPYPDYCIVQFAKAPEAGKVKTRLQPVLGQTGCLTLHTRLVEHCFEALRGAAVAPIEVAAAGDCTAFFERLTEKHAIPVSRQRGDDLGERMLNAARERLEQSSAAIIVGSDCPFFDTDYLSRACQALAEGADCVLGPAHDGGYVLIGLRRTDETLFSNVPWGTDRVLDITRTRLSGLGWRWCELEAKADIDRPQDLTQLAQVWGDCDEWLR